MKVFTTRSTEHLLDGAKRTITHFADGELFVRVDEEVQGEDVWVVAGTQPPAEHILELLLLLDALHRNGAKINLLLTYFGYARQDRITEEGSCLSAEVICKLLQLVPLQKVKSMHMHSERVKEFLTFEDIIPVSLIASLVEQADVVVAPDRGSEVFARSIAQGKHVAVMEKERISDTEVRIRETEDGVKDKTVLIVDDMISTGGTMVKAAEAVKKMGAKRILAYATHGLFCGNAVEKFMNSSIDKVYITNTLKQKPFEKLEVLDITPVIEKMIQP